MEGQRLRTLKQQVREIIQTSNRQAFQSKRFEKPGYKHSVLLPLQTCQVTYSPTGQNDVGTLQRVPERKTTNGARTGGFRPEESVWAPQRPGTNLPIILPVVAQHHVGATDPGGRIFSAGRRFAVQRKTARAVGETVGPQNLSKKKVQHILGHLLWTWTLDYGALV